jgi:hypothetical protein
MTDEEQAYSKRLYDAVLDVVIGLDADDAGTGGYVRPDIIRLVMADVAATVDNQCGVTKTPRDRRLLSETMAKRYTAMGKTLSENAEQMAGWAPATKIGSGTMN